MISPTEQDSKRRLTSWSKEGTLVGFFFSFRLGSLKGIAKISSGFDGNILALEADNFLANLSLEAAVFEEATAVGRDSVAVLLGSGFRLELFDPPMEI
jgi:hypothetical protein